MDVSPARLASASRIDQARAVWFTGPRRVDIREDALPSLGPEDIRVRAIASGISHGTEMLVYRGQVPETLELDLPTLQGSFNFPIKYGYAAVGRVRATGSAVRDISPGDLVFALHPHQTEYVAPQSLVTRLPDGIDPVHGVFLANAETALNVILDAGPRLGEDVLVIGQGVLGQLLAQLAHRSGARRVIAVDPISRRRDLSMIGGADVSVPPEDVQATVMRLTAGRGADLVLEASGNPEAIGLAIEAVAQEGTIAVCSWYGTKAAVVPLGGHFHRGRLRIISSQVGAINAGLTPRWTLQRRRQMAAELLGHLQLAPLVTHRIPFERAAEAYELIDHAPEETLQVILTYGESDV